MGPPSVPHVSKTDQRNPAVVPSVGPPSVPHVSRLPSVGAPVTDTFAQQSLLHSYAPSRSEIVRPVRRTSTPFPAARVHSYPTNVPQDRVVRLKLWSANEDSRITVLPDDDELL